MVYTKCIVSDKYKTKHWPGVMHNPRVGDQVKSLDGTILKISSITHCFPTTERGSGYPHLELVLEPTTI